MVRGLFGLIQPSKTCQINEILKPSKSMVFVLRNTNQLLM